MYFEEADFEAECNTYLILENRQVLFVPRFFGHFKDEFRNLDAILVEYVGEPVNNLAADDW